MLGRPLLPHLKQNRWATRFVVVQFNKPPTIQPMKITAVVASCLLIVTGSTFAGTPSPSAPAPDVPSSDAGWYFGLNGGALWLDDASIGRANVEFDTGWGAHGVVGYHYGNGLSAGLSAGYLGGEFDSAGVSGDLHMVPITVNGAFTVRLIENLHFYIGAGLGVAWSELDLDPAGGGRLNASTDDWSFVWQARAGFSYDISDALSIHIGYRFVDVLDGVGGFDDARGHMAEAGLKFRF
jgi:opacity protein-like surface antigen